MVVNLHRMDVAKTITGWGRALAGGFLCAAAGLVAFLWLHDLGLLSYDLLFVFRHGSPGTDLVIVYLDDRSFKETGQATTEVWDRNLHAGLLDRMTRDGAKVVVFDVLFTGVADPAATANLARAIRGNGRVALAASLDQQSRGQTDSRGAVLPQEELLEASAAWGVAAVNIEGDGVVRQYYSGTQLLPSLPWAAAQLARGKGSEGGAPLWDDRWLNFYGPAYTLPHLSYVDVASQPAGYFSNKVVFVGAGPKTLRAFDTADVLRTPYSRWEGKHLDLCPGVEVTATEFLNLWRHQSLRQFPWRGQLLGIAGSGLLVGGLLGIMRPWPALGSTLLSLAGCLVAALMAARHEVWFAWTVIALVQLPLGLAWSLRGHFQRLKLEKIVAEQTLAETTRWATVFYGVSKEGLSIPDHTLVKCVGKGAYGEVWLASNAIGAFHAVKIVKRASFTSDAPYEREFHGIQKFMPISRGHTGLVHVLHVGRHDEGRYFFYMMEVCDDATAGQSIHPESYSPKTLASELIWRGKVPVEECLRLGLTLADALEYLHQHGLVHRDIKPANIIYVGGAPKFADIGLVTEMSDAQRQVSCLGTEGYVPPEGPGAPAADVYALGKVLYEASMGRDRLLFPEVPTAVFEEKDQALLKQINRIIGRACATDVSERYASAAELRDELSRVSRSG